MPHDAPQDDDRREFLKKCGKFAVVTPPAVTALLSTSLTSEALAYSSGARESPQGWSVASGRGAFSGQSTPPRRYP